MMASQFRRYPVLHTTAPTIHCSRKTESRVPALGSTLGSGGGTAVKVQGKPVTNYGLHSASLCTIEIPATLCPQSCYLADPIVAAWLEFKCWQLLYCSSRDVGFHTDKSALDNTNQYLHPPTFVVDVLDEPGVSLHILLPLLLNPGNACL